MECFFEDAEYYKRSYGAYKKNSNRSVQWPNWMDSFYTNKVINVIAENASRYNESLKILGVGCGTGEVDHDQVSRLLTRFSKISNTVLEPTDTITEYKALVKRKPLLSVEWNWRQETFDTYHQSILETSEVPKFHYISAIGVLYYMPNWETEVMNMYNLLETGGILMITLMSEDSGFWRLWKRFPELAHHPTVQVNSNQVQTFLKTKEIDFEVVQQPSSVDITCCSIDGDEEGSLLIDFISHVKHFKAEAPPNLRDDFMGYIFSRECSHKDKDRILFDNCIEAVLVRKR
ncbi:Histamine N-methyltransferase [Holothuria leucospilota]|uniref:Histamine N-methyltransferase n=1 Tax=Holothuria leucospilota TaxID=206669 RepID=A0A9Q0YGP7_HOLLE|nr:Histamine N-methyltransferase [Holothuria leucospilota]